MDASQQTEEVFLELYNLTKMFTKALVGKYYYQFSGDIEDLASDFFTQFITPKGRSEVKESLLDKYDPSTTSLAYLVKVCVTRKLIDQSRQNPQTYISIDTMFDENGDCITKAFNLTTEEDSTRLQDPKFLSMVLTGYSKLPQEDQNKYFAAIFDSQSPLAHILHPNFKYVRDCPIQQITDKTIVLYIPKANKLVNFSLEDGHARGSFQPFSLSESELSALRQLAPYHSFLSRDLFLEYQSLV